MIEPGLPDAIGAAYWTAAAVVLASVWLHANVPFSEPPPGDDAGDHLGLLASVLMV